MIDLKARVKDFFEEYQTANAEFDIQRIAASYAGVFMFADAKGARCLNKEDFLKVLPRRKGLVKSLGLISSSLESAESLEMDSHYVLVKTIWKMRFERNTGEIVDCRNFATYVLAMSGDSFEIVFQLDHQDLIQKARELGLNTDLQK